MSVIDVHAHVIPQEIIDSFRGSDGPDGIRTEVVDGQEWVVHRQGYRYPLLPGFYDLEARLQTMQEQGTDAAVLSVAPPLFLYWSEVDEAVDASRRINDAIAKLSAQSPNHFSGLATLPLQDPDAAVAELERSVSELGLKGAEIGPHAEGMPLDSDALRPVLETAEKLQVPLEIHPYYVGSTPGMLNDFYLTNLQGNPWQTALAASRLILSGTLDALPDLDLLLVHGGGHLPYQIGRLDHGHKVRPEAKAPRKTPREYIRRFHFDTLTHDPEATRWLIERAGGDRVLYGTDEPFDMKGGSFTEQMAAVFDEDIRCEVAERNARRLFKL